MGSEQNIDKSQSNQLLSTGNTSKALIKQPDY